MEAAINDGLCDAVSSARALIADPMLVKHIREQTGGPQCTFCNACVGCIGSKPLDCYHPDIGVEKRRMLEAEGLSYD